MSKFFKNGELKDKEIANSLWQAASQYESGESLVGASDYEEAQ